MLPTGVPGSRLTRPSSSSAAAKSKIKLSLPINTTLCDHTESYSLAYAG